MLSLIVITVINFMQIVCSCKFYILNLIFLHFLLLLHLMIAINPTTRKEKSKQKWWMDGCSCVLSEWMWSKLNLDATIKLKNCKTSEWFRNYRLACCCAYKSFPSDAFLSIFFDFVFSELALKCQFEPHRSQESPFPK